MTAVALFGGVELRAPEEWEVAIDALPIFGAVEDERRRPPADATLGDGPDLILTGFVAFGWISVGS